MEKLDTSELLKNMDAGFFFKSLVHDPDKPFLKKNYWKYDDGGYVIRFCLQ